jgi:hypothetical protein
MLFVKVAAFTTKLLLFASQFTNFAFEVFAGAGEMFELKPIPALQIVLFGQQHLASLFNFIPQPRLFVFQLFAEEFTLLLKIFCLLLDFVKLSALVRLPFLPLAVKLVEFRGEFLPHGFPHLVTFGLQSFVDLLHTIGVLLVQLVGLFIQTFPRLFQRFTLLL